MESIDLEDIWEELIMDNDIPLLFINVIEEKGEFRDIIINEKNKSFDELIQCKSIIGQSIFNILKIEDREKIYTAIKENKESIIEYIGVLCSNYIIKLVHIVEYDYVLWLDKELTIDEKIIKSYINDTVIVSLFIDSAQEVIFSSNNEILFEEEGIEIDVDNNINYLNIEDNFCENIEFRNGRVYHIIKYPIEYNNEFVGLVGTSYDITDNYKCEECTGVTNRVLELMLNNSPDLISCEDKDGKILFLNKAMKDRIREFNLIFYQDYINEFNECEDYYIKYEEVEKIIHFIREIKIGDEISRYEIARFSLINEGKEIGTINIARDITNISKEKKILEKLKIDFFSNLSHELKTPLNIIYVASQTLRKVLENNNEIGGYDKYINVIDKNIFRLLRLISNLIDINKFDSNSLLFIGKNYNIIYCIETIVQLTNEYIERKDIEVIFDTNVEEYIVYFDIHKMERIIMNLISNSIKFNKDRIKVFVNILVSSDNINIIVSDNGIGIPKDKQEEIFEKFWQMGKRLTKINEGSSLGLSIVKNFVEMHGGEIKVEYSEINKGSKFSITIPNIKGEGEDQTNYLSYRDSCWDRLRIEYSDIYLP